MINISAFKQFVVNFNGFVMTLEDNAMVNIIV